jgi:hypothetical protein
LSVRLALSGGEGELVSHDGDRASLVSPTAFAPGQPLTFDALLDDGPLALEARTLGSKKREDGRFDVRVRLINLSRDRRERLARAF